MKITPVRHATLLIEVSGLTALVDPMLGASGVHSSSEWVADRQPEDLLVGLGVPLSALLSPDVVVVTHTHPDHWDAAAASLLSREVLILAQSDEDAELLRGQGFVRVTVLDDEIKIGGVSFVRTDGQHPTEDGMRAELDDDDAMGVVIRHPDEPVLYIAGDTIMHHEVRTALIHHRPDLIILNTGGRRADQTSRALMNAGDIIDVLRFAPQARVIAVHMGALPEYSTSRDDVRRLAEDRGLTDSILAPENGESLVFSLM
ncbi:MBL fold metallo-hydrolase [Microbacterium sp. SY138]|uniref:MBL fold metallo-hydrolase n=1 Tax=unclassified Microbacterium TaxID=2609290 RepID=UPI003219419C